jgi:hypothetical protein
LAGGIAGGPGDGRPVADAEIYDPNAGYDRSSGLPEPPLVPGAFKAIAGAMTEPRFQATATLLAPG